MIMINDKQNDKYRPGVSNARLRFVESEVHHRLKPFGQEFLNGIEPRQTEQILTVLRDSVTQK